LPSAEYLATLLRRQALRFARGTSSKPAHPDH
jgi:hypothetical protein